MSNSSAKSENEVLRLVPEDVEFLKNGGEAQFTRYNDDKEKVGKFVVTWEPAEDDDE